MAKILLNLAEVHESRPVPAGRYGLTIASAELGKSKGGADQLKVSIGIDGHDDAPNITHFISFPDGLDAQRDNFKSLMCKRFLAAFGIPGGPDGFDTDDFPGSQADLELGLSEPQVGSSDVYNRIVLPKLKDEGLPPAMKHNVPKPPKS